MLGLGSWLLKTSLNSQIRIRVIVAKKIINAPTIESIAGIPFGVTIVKVIPQERIKAPIIIEKIE